MTSDCELYALHERLQRFPEAVNAILQPARNLNRPVGALTTHDLRDAP